MVFSAPVLVSMLLLANRKCGLSASAAEAPITTAANAEISTNRMRRIDFPLVRFLELDRSRSARPSPPVRRCRAVRTKVRRANDRPGGEVAQAIADGALVRLAYPSLWRPGPAPTPCGIWRQRSP